MVFFTDWAFLGVWPARLHYSVARNIIIHQFPEGLSFINDGRGSVYHVMCTHRACEHGRKRRWRLRTREQKENTDKT